MPFEMPCLRNSLRTRAASGHRRVWLRSPTRSWLLSVRPPAPMAERMGRPSSTAVRMRATLQVMESMASMTTSGRGVSSSGRVSVWMNVTRGSTSQSGLMSRTRAAATSALGVPRVERRAKSWRFRLLGPTTSWSTRRRCPTPARARASTAKDPTPPSPNTTTRAWARRASAASPSSS